MSGPASDTYTGAYRTLAEIYHLSFLVQSTTPRDVRLGWARIDLALVGLEYALSRRLRPAQEWLCCSGITKIIGPTAFIVCSLQATRRGARLFATCLGGWLTAADSSTAALAPAIIIRRLRYFHDSGYPPPKAFPSATQALASYFPDNTRIRPNATVPTKANGRSSSGLGC